MLKEWERGVPVDCGPDRTCKVIKEVVAHGPHPIAMTPAAVLLFQEDITYQVAAGFAEMVLWEDLRKSLPKALKISPAAAVPQTNPVTGSSSTCSSRYNNPRRQAVAAQWDPPWPHQ
jgi:hypothetical protein